MKLSDLNPEDVQLVEEPVSSGSLKLSDLNPDEIELVDQPSSVDSSPFIGQIETDGPKTSDTDAILTGLAQGSTFGFSDELGALKDSFVDGKDYEKARDERRAANNQAYKDSPWITGAAEVVGSLPLALVPGLGAAKGASLAQKVKLGAMLGGATGLGKSESKDAGGMVKDTAIGAGVGGAGAYVADKVVSKTEQLKKYLSNKAREKALDYTEDHLRFTPGMKSALGREKVRDAATEVLDMGAIEFGAKADTTAEILDKAVKEVGQIKQQMVEEASGTIDPLKLAQRIDDEVIAPLRNRPLMEPVVAKLERDKARILKHFAPDYKPGGPLPGSPITHTQIVQAGEKPAAYSGGLFSEPATEMRVFHMGTVPEPKPVTAKQIFQTKKDAAGNTNFFSSDNADKANQAFVNTLGRVEDELIADPRLKAINKLYHNLSNAEVAAERTGNLTANGGLMSHITDSAFAAATLSRLMDGNPVGLAAAAGRSLTKGRMDSAAAVGLNKLSQHLKANPQAFGKYTQQLEQAAQRGTLPVINYLLQQRDPNYRALVQDLDKKQ
jgi:hypothetical protein